MSSKKLIIDSLKDSTKNSKTIPITNNTITIVPALHHSRFKGTTYIKDTSFITFTAKTAKTYCDSARLNTSIILDSLGNYQ